MSIFHFSKQNSLEAVDDKIIKMLKNQSKYNNEYWSFNGRSAREHTHVFYQYPAMMIPNMQSELLSIIINFQPNITNVFDPFVGSGTTMTEVMFHGLNFVGQDINPLAVLLCRAKMGPFYCSALKEKKEELFHRICNDKSKEIDIYFPGLIKWFKSEVAVELSRIRRAITNERSLWARRFFWVSLSETIRLSSNSRTSTYKLHSRTKEDIECRNINVIALFEYIVNRNIRELIKQKNILNNKGFLYRGRYSGKVEIHLKDSCKGAALLDSNTCYDLVVTSPPYGDNKSTVPYGQSSFLPLQWIQKSDVDPEMNDSWLCTTHEIDSRSMGGRLAIDDGEVLKLNEISPNFSKIIISLNNQKRDRKKRVSAFYIDFNKSLKYICDSVRKNGYLIWTVGNRHVGSLEIPMDKILVELLQNKGVELVYSIDRKIPSKRMPNRNNVASTMKKEKILLFRKLFD